MYTSIIKIYLYIYKYIFIAGIYINIHIPAMQVDHMMFGKKKLLLWKEKKPYSILEGS